MTRCALALAEAAGPLTGGQRWAEFGSLGLAAAFEMLWLLCTMTLAGEMR